MIDPIHQREQVIGYLHDSAHALLRLPHDDIICAGKLLSSLLSRGKVLLIGNGGSAADCQHIAAELIGRYKKERGPLPAIALTTDTSALTAISNDYCFEDIFTRQIGALGTSHDALIAISTSGNSKNILLAMAAAKQLGMTIIGITGETGGLVPCHAGRFEDLCTICIKAPSRNTPIIQQAHITIGHLLCEIIEQELFPDD